MATAAVAQTRLDRLVTLLESGSTPTIRATAARQLGQFAAARVRGGGHATTATALSVGKERDGEKDVEEKTIKKEDDEKTLSVGAAEGVAPTTTTTTTSSSYRGIEGEWDQAVYLLARVLPYLRSKTWDTRVAAAQAIEAICGASGTWDPDSASVDGQRTANANDEETRKPLTEAVADGAQFTFETFSLSAIHTTGKKLLSSAGNEYDLPASMSVEERLTNAKRDMQRLGLGSMAGVDMDLGVDVEKELLGGSGGGEPIATAPTAAEHSPAVAAAAGPSTASPPVAQAEEVDLSLLSARERNQLKRKRKLESKTGAGSGGGQKTRVVEPSDRTTTAPHVTGSVTLKSPASAEVNGNENHLKLPSNGTDGGGGAERIHSLSPTPSGNVGVGSSMIESTSLIVPRDQWPFTLVCALLLSDLFAPKWEVRHGAALGLRELFKWQGASGGKVIDTTNVDNAVRHARWYNDAALRLLCVLTLDRLGDFVFDQVIAPVRETAAQALASLLKWMDAESVAKVHGLLHDMITQSFLLPDNATATTKFESIGSLPARRGVSGYAWEVRHAGLLGLRYEVTVRKDLLVQGDVLNDITRLAVSCLRDDDDDVRSVAASTLLPIVDEIVERLPELVALLLEQLWSSLIMLKDDLSSSTGGVMDLLARLAEKPKVVKEHFTTSSAVDIPRLYPFFRHTITSVRLSVLNALRSFLSMNSLGKGWVDERLVRLVFQNLIVEERLAIREASMDVWNKTLAIVIEQNGIPQHVGPHLARFSTLLMTPLGTPIDFTLFYKASSGIASRETHNVDKGILSQDLALVGVDTVIRGRLGAAQALGSVIAAWPQECDQSSFATLLLDYLQSTSALQKCLAGVVIQEWAERVTERKGETHDLLSASPLASQAHAKLLSILEAPAPSTYAEMAVMLQRIQRQCQGLHTALIRDGKVKKDRVPTLPSDVDPTGTSKDAFTIATATSVVGKGYETLVGQIPAKSKAAVLPALEERRVKLIAEIGFYQSIKEKQDSQVAASAASAVIALHALPAKLNPIIRSVMNSVKFEENADLQRRSARAVAKLIELLCHRSAGQANPSDKIVKNLCAFVCQDATQTPIFDRVKAQTDGIFSLAESEASIPTTGRRRSADQAALTEEEREGQNIRRGAEVALEEITRRFGPSVFDSLPTLWQSMSLSLMETFQDEGDANEATGQSIVDACTLLQVNVRHLDDQLHGKVCELLPYLGQAVKSRFSVIRSTAAKTLATLTESMTERVMLFIVRHVLPLLGDATNVIHRQGAIEVVASVVNLMDLTLLPYVIVLIVPVLGRMSDADEAVRLVATNTFAALVKMVPLEAGLPDPIGFPEELMSKRQEERQFLAQLLDGSKVESYSMPVPVKADLRKYQIDGISWMAFLAKFHLHGVLCDDMGLGKTLQSICILSSKHFERQQQFDRSGSVDARPLPSLIVCPPTLTGHWCHEIKQYATNLRPMLYAGHPNERARLQLRITEYDCVVASYDTVRNDIEALAKHDWLYCILDEGHIIKSAKTKTTKAVKQIRAQHRLILSGTPIQNNVLELWSLFDFLMPGFLGTEKQFMDRYGKPILASRDAKVTAKEHERASLALEALHKQVLPFLLRRMKEDVLADLPPKIIQDISCELSDVQRQLFNEYMKTQNPDEFDDQAIRQQGGAKQHVFQTLQYLRKLVCHPSMVYDPDKPRHREILAKSAHSSLNDIANAPKLLALKQLLQDCGIGKISTDNANTFDDAEAVSQHRVLIFCQQRRMLDIIENDLFRSNMPSVTYARLDGSISSPEKRFAIVQRFNSDPSIDVLLLTTSVGGLGLTLTGADTVIFVEHDWNPMKDMQAMDRAHRLGQKKVVNVYRLITKDTLEEQIMGLQQFKLNVAGNIVNQQNKAMDSMQTDQILDLFDTGSSQTANSENATDGAAQKKVKGLSQKALLASLEEMDDSGDDYKDLHQWSAAD